MSLASVLESIANGASDAVEWEVVEELIREIEDDYGLTIRKCEERVGITRSKVCGAPVEPDREAFRLGVDHDGNEVFMQRWTCIVGHFYMTEVR